MATDGLFIYQLTKELQQCVHGRINKIHQPSDTDIVMQIRLSGKTVRLLLSANLTYPRVHITEKQYQNPLEAPMFCMLLRKHCEGGMIERIEQPDLERIIRIHIRQRDEMGDITYKILVMEIMGRHSNLILLDAKTNMILDSIHHVTPAVSSHRVVLPGQTYVDPPVQHKEDPFQAERKGLEEIMLEHIRSDQTSDISISSWIVQTWMGLSPTVANEIVHLAGIEPNLNLKELAIRHVHPFAEAFSSFMEKCRKGQMTPCIKTLPNGKLVYYFTELRHLKGDTKEYHTLSELLEAYYGDKAERDAIQQKTGNLKRWLQNEKAKNEKKRKKLQQTIEDSEKAEMLRISGELLTASLHEIKRGQTSIEVLNYYDENQSKLKIALDPKLSPSENAQRYFKKYNKAKNSVHVVLEQLKQTEIEIEYLNTLLQQIEDASLSDVEEMREELVAQGYLKDRQKKDRKKRKNDKPRLLCYVSTEGIEIYVGKNNTQNDYLTNRLARSQDTWLHTKDIPGSHVIIRSSQFGDTTLKEAAMLAAYYSQAKFSSQVPVDYTQVKYVRKPNGAKPGFVIYDHQKTLFITPDKERIETLNFEIK